MPAAGLLIAANAGLLMMAGRLPSLHLASTYVASVSKLVKQAAQPATRSPKPPASPYLACLL